MGGAFVTVEGYKIYYTKEGEKGEPILLVHGLPTSSYLWRHVQKKLAENYQVYAIDMLGYGKSDKPEEASYTWNAQAERLKGFLDAVGLNKVTLVGHDHGGAVTLIFGCKYTERLNRYIFANGCSYDYCLPEEVRAIGTLANFPDEMLSAFSQFVLAFLGFGMRAFACRREALSIPVMRGYYEPWKTLEGFKALTKHCSQPSNEEILALDLKKIKVPILVVWALKDPFLPIESAYRLKKDLGGPVRMATIENASHFFQEDEPGKFAEIVHDFMTSS